MDIFDLIGPIMVGPSSSHTAGAVRIGLVARRLLGEEPVRAGLLGMEPDDSRIPDSFDHAAEHGLKFEFGTCTLREAHPNSVLLRVTGGSGRHVKVVGASIGGGRIQIRQLNGMPLCFSAEQPTLIVNNEDQPGSVADVSRLLADHGINIATFQVNRSSRGGTAVMVIECDATLSEDIASDIRRLPGILNAVCV